MKKSTGGLSLWAALALAVAVAPAAYPRSRSSRLSEYSVSSGITAQAPGLVSIDELSMRARTKTVVMPDYPKLSIERTTVGVAVAAVRVGVDGRVERVEILQAPDPAIGIAVSRAARQWVFQPILVAAGERWAPAQVATKLTFYFNVETDGKGVVSAPKARDATAGRESAGATRDLEVRELDRDGMVRLSGARGVVIIDIRSRDQFRSGHDPRAVSMPIDEVGSRVREVASAKVVIVDCRPGMIDVCRMAARELLRAGLTADVRVLRRDR